MAPDHPPAPRARLYLVSPPRFQPDAFARALAEALEAADAACLLVSLEGADEALWGEALAAVLPVAQQRDVAVLLDGRPDLVRPLWADGAHLGTGVKDLRAALAALKPGLILGAGGLGTRHEAMEAAEAGVDYVAFGAPHGRQDAPDAEDLVERVAWWAEVFEVPQVAFADGLDVVPRLARAGADFVAVGEAVWSAEEGPAAVLARLDRELAAAAAVSPT